MERFIDDLLWRLCCEQGVKTPLIGAKGVEITMRRKDDHEYIFILNHNDYLVMIDLASGRLTNLLNEEQVEDSITVEAKGVAILKKQ